MLPTHKKDHSVPREISDASSGGEVEEKSLCLSSPGGERTLRVLSLTRCPIRERGEEKGGGADPARPVGGKMTFPTLLQEGDTL